MSGAEEKNDSKTSRGKKSDGNGEGRSGKGTGLPRLEALSLTLQTFKSACDTITTVSDNRRERARIVADSEESVREYKMRRDALQAAITQTFSERNRTLDEYFRHLDDAMSAGDLQKAHMLTSNITEVVKSGPLKALADLRAGMMSGNHRISLGASD